MKNRVMAVVLSCVLVLVGSAQVSVAASVGVVKSGKSVDVCVDSVSKSVRVLGSGCVSGRELKQVWSAGVGAPALCVSRVSRDVLIAPASGCGAGAKLLKASSGGRALLCADGVSGVLRWPETGVCNSTNRSLLVRLFTQKSVPVIVPVVAAPVVVPAVSLAATTIGDGTWPKAVTVTANVVGTVYFAEGDFVVKTVSDITSAPSYRWAKGTITVANTPTSIAVDVDVVSNGYYRVYVANAQGVLSAPAVNKLTISITRESDLPKQTVAPVCVATASSVSDHSTDFVMTVDTRLSTTNRVSLPLNGSYNVLVNWGDGTIGRFESGDAKDPCHIYSSERTYVIRISGNLDHFGILEAGDSEPWVGVESLTTVSNFGDLGIESLTLAFYGASSLTEVPTVLPSSVTTLWGIFAEATTFNQPLNGWNVSSVTDMSYMFWHADSFDQDLNGWDVSSVTDMSGMFQYAVAFDGDISAWNVLSVKSMPYMFHGTIFNGNISLWDVDNVTDMSAMFVGSSFNGNISLWDVDNVTDMSAMFVGSSFTGDISDWNVSKVTDMTSMFAQSSFNGEISFWNVSRVVSMVSMFFEASAFNQPLNGWNVSSVTDMSNMFYHASAFNQPLNSWNVSNVQYMKMMFDSAVAFNQPLDSWNVSSVTDMSWMFYHASAFNGNISGWNVGQVFDMTSMFDGASEFNIDISGWDVSSVRFMNAMFYDAAIFNRDISLWDVSSVTDMTQMFDQASAFNIDISHWDVSNVADMANMFNASGRTGLEAVTRETWASLWPSSHPVLVPA